MHSQNLRHVLDGYTVLDFTQFVAGPTVTLMMAEMGAEIIKIELAPGGDPTRTWPLVKGQRSGYFVQHNRGKRSLCIDAKSPEGQLVLKGLVKKVDVLVQNYAPGVIDRLGLSYENVGKINPNIIMCSVSSFGQTGPLANETGYDWSGAAYAGILHMVGEPDAPPVVPSVAIGDVSTGVHAVAAIGYALLYRERTGKGQHLDISLLDTYFHYHEASAQLYSLSGGAFNPKRTGRHALYVSPAGIFKSKDGSIIIMAQLDHQWAKLCEAMGQPELVRDPRFATNDLRCEHRDEITNVIEQWLGSLPSDGAAMNILKEKRIPHAPVLTFEQAMNHPHLRQRGTVRTIRDRALGEFRVPGFPLRFSEFPNTLELQAPYLGEHNELVLSRYLGYTSQQIRELESKDIIRSAAY